MKIYTMTATFGKLNHETLSLQPGLNVIHAPNEWGKSTWCAFLTAMLYGLDTRSHSTKTALSDKDRYTPWSGNPMEGRIDLNWKGRDITIERKNKGRTVFGDFRAYETASGIPVPELTGQNCGQLLVGVERSVFTRSAMIRLADLPVTQDEALRRRLNALVTTGDDSGTGDQLERKLRELKNRCRYNRTGLLPQAEAEAAQLKEKLRELDDLETQSRTLRQRCGDLEHQISQLENHKTALVYQKAQENAQRLHSAQQQLQQAEAALQTRQQQCSRLPSREEIRDTLPRLQDLQHRRTLYETDAVPAASLPEHPVFHDLPADEAYDRAVTDAKQYHKLTSHSPLPLILGIPAAAAGICMGLFVPEYRSFCLAAAVLGVLLCALWGIRFHLNRSRAKQLAARYGSADPALWLREANRYASQLNLRTQAENQRQAALGELKQEALSLCGDRAVSHVLSEYLEAKAMWEALDAAQRNFLQLQEYRDALVSLTVAAPRPLYPDNLTLDEGQTEQFLTKAARELRETQHRLGQCQGQMAAIGSRSALEARLDSLSQRIRQLEDTHSALTIALTTLEKARTALQQRFAPRITGRARELLSRLTDGRYDRLVLGSDFTLQATARDEDTLRSSLWRSDGTADLLFLALRLAVAGELTPQGPMILDDALVRFDDRRLAKTMALLKEEAAHRQIILFTCHRRELAYEKPEP